MGDRLRNSSSVCKDTTAHAGTGAKFLKPNLKTIDIMRGWSSPIAFSMVLLLCWNLAFVTFYKHFKSLCCLLRYFIGKFCVVDGNIVLSKISTNTCLVMRPSIHEMGPRYFTISHIIRMSLEYLTSSLEYFQIYT